MSITTRRVPWFLRFMNSLVLAVISLTALGASAPAIAQEPSAKTFAERAREYRDKIVASMESTVKAAGDEFSKLRSEAAKAKGPAREKLDAEMEALGKKWAAAREKLAASLETHMHSVGEDIKKLEENTAQATGSAREQSASELQKLHGEWTIAREKMGAALSSNMTAAREEFAHLKEQSANASADAKVKLAPRMEKLKAEWSKNREKLAAHLDADLKKTKEEVDKFVAETSNEVKLAKAKLLKKYHELRAQSDDLGKEKSLDESK